MASLTQSLPACTDPQSRVHISISETASQADESGCARRKGAGCGNKTETVSPLSEGTPSGKVAELLRNTTRVALEVEWIDPLRVFLNL